MIDGPPSAVALQQNDPLAVSRLLQLLNQAGAGGASQPVVIWLHIDDLHRRQLYFRKRIDGEAGPTLGRV